MGGAEITAAGADRTQTRPKSGRAKRRALTTFTNESNGAVSTVISSDLFYPLFPRWILTRRWSFGAKTTTVESVDQGIPRIEHFRPMQRSSSGTLRHDARYDV